MASFSCGETLEKAFQQFQASFNSTVSHLKCNYLSYIDGLCLKNLNILRYCRAYLIISSIFLQKILKKRYCETNQKETCLILKSQSNLRDLINEFNNFSDQNKNRKNVSNWKYYNLLTYYTITELKSTIIEIINHKKSNISLVCIYKHPLMYLNEFGNYYLNKLFLIGNLMLT